MSVCVRVCVCVSLCMKRGGPPQAGMSALEKSITIWAHFIQRTHRHKPHINPRAHISQHCSAVTVRFCLLFEINMFVDFLFYSKPLSKKLCLNCLISFDKLGTR